MIASSGLELSSSQLPSDEAVREELGFLLASKEFKESPRLSRFLAYVVSEALASTQGALKESVIGVAVFDREPSYDPKTDPVVRTEARRLRQRLELHYAGRASAVVQVTIPKGGYAPLFALTGPDLKLPPVPEISTAPAHPQAPGVATPRKHGWSFWAMAGVFGLFLLLTTAYFLRPVAEVPQVLVPFKTEPLTTETGLILGPSFGPVGGVVAYSFRKPGEHFRIFVAEPGGRAIPLTSGQSGDELNPAWSPDGTEIAYLRVQDGRTQVRTVGFPGGTDQLRFYSESSISLEPDPTQSSNITGPIWAPNGAGLLLSEPIAHTDSSAIFLHSLRESTAQQITHPQGSERDLMPSIAPDVHALAFSRTFSNSTSDIMVKPWVSGKERQLTYDHADIRGLAWFRQGVIFSSNRSGNYALWRVPVRGGSPSAVLSTGTVAVEPAGAHDGSRIAYVDRVLSGSIYRLNLAGKGKPLVELIPSAKESNSPQYSPDQQHIAFTSNSSGHWELWEAEADGSATQQLTHLSSSMLGTPRWSPNGQMIAFDARPGKHSEVYTIRADGSQLRQLTSGANAENKQPSWSIDGKSLFYVSIDSSGKEGLWSIATTGGVPELLLKGRIADPQVSTSRPVVYYKDLESRRLREFNVLTRKVTNVPGLEDVDPDRLWSVTRERIYYLDRKSGERELRSWNEVTHQITSIAYVSILPEIGTPNLSVSTDGRSALITADKVDHGDATVAFFAR